jgi:hypothetical protein
MHTDIEDNVLIGDMSVHGRAIANIGCDYFDPVLNWFDIEVVRSQVRYEGVAQRYRSAHIYQPDSKIAPQESESARDEHILPGIEFVWHNDVPV